MAKQFLNINADKLTILISITKLCFCKERSSLLVEIMLRVVISLCQISLGSELGVTYNI